MKDSALPTPKQLALLTYIQTFIKENNYAPSYREVMGTLGYKSVSTVATHINGLIARGWLVKRDNSARSVEMIYGAGKTEGQKSPATSLPDSHETWLKGIIDARLAKGDASPEEIAAIGRTLAWLGIDALAPSVSQAD